MNRRDFLATGATAGMVALSASRAPAADTARPATDSHRRDYQFGVHHYSIKPLWDIGEVQLESYPEFAAESLSAPRIEIAEELAPELFSNRDLCRRVRTAAEQHGEGVHAILCDGRMALDSPDPDVRRAAVQHHLRVAVMGAAVGARFLRVRASTPGDPDEQLRNAIDGLQQLTALIPRSGPQVLLENIAGNSRNPDWLTRFSSRTGIRLLADFANFDGDIYDGMKAIMPFTDAVCTKSWEFDEQGEETTIDFARMMNIIDDSGFNGVISVEYLGRKSDPVTGIRQTIDLVKRHSH
jgi:sugar phosphate isomerase/epimerase